MSVKLSQKTKLLLIILLVILVIAIAVLGVLIKLGKIKIGADVIVPNKVWTVAEFQDNTWFELKNIQIVNNQVMLARASDNITYLSSGTITQIKSHDAGVDSAVWQEADFNLSNMIPAGTNLTMNLCAASNEAMTNQNCSDFAPQSYTNDDYRIYHPTTAAPPVGRFSRITLTLTTTDPAQSPILNMPLTLMFNYIQACVRDDIFYSLVNQYFIEDAQPITTSSADQRNLTKQIGANLSALKSKPITIPTEAIRSKLLFGDPLTDDENEELFKTNIEPAVTSAIKQIILQPLLNKWGLSFKNHAEQLPDYKKIGNYADDQTLLNKTLNGEIYTQYSKSFSIDLSAQPDPKKIVKLNWSFTTNVKINRNLIISYSSCPNYQITSQLDGKYLSNIFTQGTLTVVDQRKKYNVGLEYKPDTSTFNLVFVKPL